MPLSIGKILLDILAYCVHCVTCRGFKPASAKHLRYPRKRLY